MSLRRVINKAVKRKPISRAKRVAELKTKKLLTGTEAAEYLNISYPTFLKIVYSGEVPFISVGERRRFTIEILDNYVENQYCQY